MLSNLIIRPLNEQDSEKLIGLFYKGGANYRKYFTPFHLDLNSISKIIKKAINNRYYGFFYDDSLIGFFMLRGLDEGYHIPSYGVFIDPDYQGYGLATLSLLYSISQCKLSGIKKLMLKVYPDNTKAYHIYNKYGFKKIGTDPTNQNYILIKEL